MSRFAPLDYDQQGLPIRDLAGYRESKSYGDLVTFYVLPDAFNKEVAKGFDPKLVAKVLHEAGMLMKPAKGNRYQKLTPHLKHLGGIRQRAYVLRQVTVDDDD